VAVFVDVTTAVRVITEDTILVEVMVGGVYVTVSVVKAVLKTLLVIVKTDVDVASVSRDIVTVLLIVVVGTGHARVGHPTGNWVVGPETGGVTGAADEEDDMALHVPNWALQPVPQYASPLPQKLCDEQQGPNREPKQVIPVPQLPSVLMTKGDEGTDVLCAATNGENKARPMTRKSEIRPATVRIAATWQRI
jgi:hypothetical protein